MNADDIPKEWKTSILSSGLPLEQAVINSINQKQYQDNGEEIVEREGKYFSIDICAEKEFNFSNTSKFLIPIKITLLIECKYLRKPRSIIFSDLGPKNMFSSRSLSINTVSSVGYNLINQLYSMDDVLPQQIPWLLVSLFESFPNKIAFCHKGTVIPDCYDLFRETQYQIYFH